MEISKYIQTALMAVPDWIANNRVEFWITLVIMIIVFSCFVIGGWVKTKTVSMFFYRLVHLVLSIINAGIIITVGILFLVADNVYKIDPDILTNRFFVELVAVSVIYFAYHLLLFYLYKVKKVDNDDFSEEIIEVTLKAIVVIIISLVCIFTNLETEIRPFGFMIFGKTLGENIYSFFLAAALSMVLLVVRDFIQIPILIFMGSPISINNIEKFVETIFPDTDTERKYYMNIPQSFKSQDAKNAYLEARNKYFKREAEKRERYYRKMPSYLEKDSDKKRKYLEERAEYIKNSENEKHLIEKARNSRG